jgi:hypothetical protein
MEPPPTASFPEAAVYFRFKRAIIAALRPLHKGKLGNPKCQESS